MHKFAGLIPDMLIRRIREHQCVIFAGAGLSAQAKANDGASIPTWKTLLEHMIDWCSEHRVQLRAEPHEFREIIEKGRLLVVAQELQMSLGQQLNSCLSDILHSGDTKPSMAHRLLCATNWVSVLTSNYDALIEGAYAAEYGGILPPVFSLEGVNQAIDCLRNDKHFVFKVHGDINIPNSIVLGNRDYSKLLYQSPAYRSFLETIFASYTVLFVGFSGNDPDLDEIIDRLSTIYERSLSQHFILISEDEFSALERRRLLEDKRLDCITYQKDSSHSQVVEFLKALSQRTSKQAEEPKPFTSEDRRPRIFVSGSYQNIDLMRQVSEIVKQIGFETWFAETQISAGDSIQDTISKAIDETDCLVAILSEESTKSSWVQFEIGRAWGAHKKILPIKVGNARVPSDLMGIMYLQLESSKLNQRDIGLLKESFSQLLSTIKNG
jgi:hypothetical protein